MTHDNEEPSAASAGYAIGDKTMNVNDGMIAAALWLAVASLSVSLVALWVSVDDSRSATGHVLAWMREQEQINRLLRMRVEQLERADGDA